MRRKTQGIPDTPRSADKFTQSAQTICEHGRLSAHHTRTSLRRAGADLAAFSFRHGAALCLHAPARMASAGSRQEALVPPGGAPMQPECMRDERTPAGATPRSIN
jgi:hypothetical protein